MEAPITNHSIISISMLETIEYKRGNRTKKRKDRHTG